MSRPDWITTELLQQLSARAQAAPRRRQNHNFHASDAAPCHRLLNAIEPDSYVAPHRHLDTGKDETLVVVTGRLGLVFFDDAGNVTETAVLAAGGPRFGVTIPTGVFHSAVALVTGTVFFEAKAGPYSPLTPAERAPWAPVENDPAAAPYLATLRQRCA